MTTPQKQREQNRIRQQRSRDRRKAGGMIEVRVMIKPEGRADLIREVERINALKI